MANENGNTEEGENTKRPCSSSGNFSNSPPSWRYRFQVLILDEEATPEPSTVRLVKSLITQPNLPRMVRR